MYKEITTVMAKQDIEVIKVAQMITMDEVDGGLSQGKGVITILSKGIIEATGEKVALTSPLLSFNLAEALPKTVTYGNKTIPFGEVMLIIKAVVEMAYKGEFDPVLKPIEEVV